MKKSKIIIIYCWTFACNCMRFSHRFTIDLIVLNMKKKPWNSEQQLQQSKQSMDATLQESKFRHYDVVLLLSFFFLQNWNNSIDFIYYTLSRSRYISLGSFVILPTAIACMLLPFVGASHSGAAHAITSQQQSHRILFYSRLIAVNRIFAKDYDEMVNVHWNTSVLILIHDDDDCCAGWRLVIQRTKFRFHAPRCAFKYFCVLYWLRTHILRHIGTWTPIPRVQVRFIS